MSQVPDSTSYDLTNLERAGISGLNMQVVAAKAHVYDAKVAEEAAATESAKARAALHDAEQQLQGALNMLATSHDMGGARISPDMTRLIKEG